MVAQDKRREYIEVYVQGAENWRAKGVLAREANSLSSVILNCLAIAVVECDNVECAKTWFATDVSFTSAWHRYQEVLTQLITLIDAGKVPASTIAGNYPHLVFTHLTWALGELETGEGFARIAARPDVLELSTPFWQEYSRAIQSLIKGRSYSASDLATGGQEQYWLPYLRLIEQATNGEEISAAVTEIDTAFGRRNADKSIKDDAHEIEGSGNHPVRWDFRRDGLLNYIQK